MNPVNQWLIKTDSDRITWKKHLNILEISGCQTLNKSIIRYPFTFSCFTSKNKPNIDYIEA